MSPNQGLAVLDLYFYHHVCILLRHSFLLHPNSFILHLGTFWALPIGVGHLNSY